MKPCCPACASFNLRPPKPQGVTWRCTVCRVFFTEPAYREPKEQRGCNPKFRERAKPPHGIPAGRITIPQFRWPITRTVRGE